MNKSRFAIAAAGAVAALPLMGALPAPPVQQIQLFSYGYSPGPIVLSAGQPVTLQFVNRAGKGHDFSAPEFFATARILAGSVKDGEVDLRGGESATVTLVPARGTYKVHCGHPFHALLGMHTHIVVR
jgi:plastocyanin